MPPFPHSNTRPEPAPPVPQSEIKPNASPPVSYRRPATAAEGDGLIPALRMVNFQFNQAEIEAPYRQAIAYDAQVLKRHPRFHVVIEGHCDDRGPRKYNYELGLKRARAVEHELEQEGVPSAQMEVVSLGKDEPLEIDHSRGARAVNRGAVVRER